MNEPEVQERPRRNPLVWPIRFLLHLVIKLLVLVVIGIRTILRPKIVRFGIVALLLVGVVAWNVSGPVVSGRTVNNAQTQSSYQSASAGNIAMVQPSGAPQQAPAVEQYLRAQASFDANGMWSSISDDLKQQLSQQNTSLKDLQTQLDNAKQSGRQYKAASYVGGADLDDSSTVYFYVLTVDTPSGTVHVPYMYVVDSSGKIASIQ